MTTATYQIPAQEKCSEFQKFFEKQPGKKFGTLNTPDREYIILSFEPGVFVTIPKSWLIN